MNSISAAAALLLGVTAANAQTLDDLKSDGRNTDHILTYGMGYHQQRYSPLNQINKRTVRRLVPAWNLSLDNNWGEQAQPIVYNGVMYVTNARATVAIDVATGKQLWKHTLDWPPGRSRGASRTCRRDWRPCAPKVHSWYLRRQLRPGGRAEPWTTSSAAWSRSSTASVYPTSSGRSTPTTPTRGRSARNTACRSSTRRTRSSSRRRRNPDSTPPAS